MNGTCLCDFNWGGQDCARPMTCKNNCTGRGFCTNGQCLCPSGWGGDDCSVRRCKNDCSFQGKCNKATGQCVCKSAASVARTAPHLCARAALTAPATTLRGSASATLPPLVLTALAVAAPVVARTTASATTARACVLQALLVQTAP